MQHVHATVAPLFSSVRHKSLFNWLLAAPIRGNPLSGKTTPVNLLPHQIEHRFGNCGGGSVEQMLPRIVVYPKALEASRTSAGNAESPNTLQVTQVIDYKQTASITHYTKKRYSGKSNSMQVG